MTAVGDWVEPAFPPTYHRLLGRIIQVPRGDLLLIDWLQLGPGGRRARHRSWRHPEDVSQITPTTDDEFAYCLCILEES